MALVDPTRSYHLDPWPRVEGDEVGGRYRLQMVGLCNLEELAINTSAHIRTQLVFFVSNSTKKVSLDFKKI